MSRFKLESGLAPVNVEGGRLDFGPRREGDPSKRVTLPAGLKHSPPLHGWAIRAGCRIGKLSFWGLMIWWTFLLQRHAILKALHNKHSSKKKGYNGEFAFLALVHPVVTVYM